MNANELTDKLEETRLLYLKQIGINSQLQSENNLLKEQVKRLKEIIEKSIDMNNALGKM